MFDRAISGKDIASGKRTVRGSYKTVGTAKSTYREGNSTVQLDDIAVGATTYNTTTNEPNPITNGTSKAKRSLKGAGKRSRKLFKPVSSAGPVRP